MRALVALLLLAAAGDAAAGCSYPAPVTIPSGKTASRADMAAAQKLVQGYVDRMQQYLDCLDQEEAALPADQQTGESRALTVKRHNAAVEAMERLAAQFNEEVRAYRAAGGR